MNQSEIDLVKDKVLKSKLFLLFFLIFICGWLILWINYKFGFLIQIIGLIVVIFILILIFYFFKNWKNSKIDLKKNIKISETFKIIDKYIVYGGGPVKYIIVFESRKIKKFQLEKKDYNVVQINDYVKIEYSKYAHWILKIEHNGKSIANKNVLA